MIVLGIDTSTTSTAAALRLADGTTTERRDDPVSGTHPGHATRLLAMVDELLATAGIDIDGVGRIAVGSGPGTFTGLRVGIATARGLAQSLGIELAAVSSLLALAHGTLAAAGDTGRPVIAAIDARRGEVFAAAYSAGEDQLAAGRALPPEELGTLLAEGVSRTPCHSPWVTAPCATGPRSRPPAPRCRPRARRFTCCAPPPSASSALAVPVMAYGDVLPDYLRRPDAELALDGASGGGAS